MGFRLKKDSVIRNQQEQGSQVAGAVRQPKPKLNSKHYLALVIIIIAVVFIGRIFLVQRAELDALKAQQELLEQRIADMKTDIISLEEEAERLSDLAYIEQIARLEYGMVGEDDLVFIPAETVKGQ